VSPGTLKRAQDRRARNSVWIERITCCPQIAWTHCSRVSQRLIRQHKGRGFGRGSGNFRRCARDTGGCNRRRSRLHCVAAASCSRKNTERTKRKDYASPHSRSIRPAWRS
jgi:hypothetical protein